MWSSFGPEVLGDTDSTNDLLIDTNSNISTVFGNRFTGAWASNASGTNVVIKNSAGSPNFAGFDFVQGTFMMNSAATAAFDIKAGVDIQIRDSKFCPSGTVTGAGIIIEGTASDVSIQNNRIGTCGDSYNGGILSTGISVTTSASNIGIITGNDFTNSTVPINWAPTAAVNNLLAVVSNNSGLDNQTGPPIASAGTITLGMASIEFVSGTNTISTINTAWQGRVVQLVAVSANGFSLSNSGGNICTNATLKNTFESVLLTYNAGFGCWLVH